MIGWAILGITIILALTGGVIWWFCADTRRTRARRRLAPAQDTASGPPDGEWSVAAIAARVERERDDSEPYPGSDDAPDLPSRRGDHDVTPDMPRDLPDNMLPFPPQRTAARMRPYIQPNRQPRRPPPPAVADLTATPRLGFPAVSPADLVVLQRVRDGLHRLQ